MPGPHWAPSLHWAQHRPILARNCLKHSNDNGKPCPPNGLQRTLFRHCALDGGFSMHQPAISPQRFLTQAVRAVGRMADVNLRHDAGFGSVAGAERLGKGRGLILVHQVDGAAAEAAAG
jgi:hypothetical protein